MDTWIDELAGALEVERLSQEAADELLQIARDVAHRTERRLTPLATFLVGVAVGRAAAAGTTVDQARSDALATLETRLPPP